ncbi:MAG TPA: tripartite tricarboxylate transporter substrate binding protein [Bordetella sp.]|nr:tripartite tricarboxylate transporter substrate binding protein [Bordetella sp.]
MGLRFNPGRRAALGMGAALGLARALPAWAQDYPSKPIRLVVPFATGGGSDTVARAVAEKLTVDWKQPIIVDNRPGAGGALGTNIVARSAPDGYTLLLSDASAVTINPSLYPKLPYSAADLTPVINVATFALVLVVPVNSPIKSVQDLVAMDKANPGHFNAASSGPGSSPHLMLEMMNAIAGTKLVHVPYKGGGPAMIDVVAGQVDLMFNGLSGGTMSLITGGKVRALAVTTAKRIASLPDVPTLAESGYPGVEVVSAQSLFVPAGTPAPIVDALNTEITRILQLPDIEQRWAQSGFLPPQKESPAQVAAWFASESEKWSKLISDRKITVE